MSNGDMLSGWYVRGHDGTNEWQNGPYTWAELVEYARDGRLVAHNFVWHAARPDWQAAGTVPGLFDTPAEAPTATPADATQPLAIEPEPVAAAPAPEPAEQPAPQPSPAPYVAPQPQYAAPEPQYAAPVDPYAQAQYAQAAPAPAAPKRKRGGLIALVAAVAAIALAGCGFGAWMLFFRDGGGDLLSSGDGPSLGTAETKVPDPASLVQTTTWGEVPANQVSVLMAEGSDRGDAEKVAEALGGTVVGELEFISLYQIEFPGTTEADLTSAIQIASAAEGVDYAFPNQQIYSDVEIWGVRIDPYNDPIYGGGAGDGYKAIGLSRAWAFIRGSGVELNNVKVGVVDDGLYIPGDGAENEFEGGKTKIEFPDPAAGELATPEVRSDGQTNAAGSHGTGVSTVIGADPDNGGPSGVAGPLGDKLTISMINHYAGQYGTVEAPPDPNDPTKFVWTNGKTYVDGSLVALNKQIENGATVINCSWGNSQADTATVAAYTRYFTKMAEEHPDVLFVCSGGNGGQVMNGAARIPSGLPLPNMITVGALDNDGKTATYADKASGNYEITLGAPGTGAVVGIDPNGGPVRQDGSSFAAPHVAAAAAILKSLNPDLTAGEIKQLLVDTARPGVPTSSTDPNAQSQLIGPEMGAGILAIDQAVLQVINDLRADKGLEPFTEDMLEKLGVVDAVAVTGEAGQYHVRGIVEATGEQGTGIKIEVSGTDYAIGGDTEQALGGADRQAPHVVHRVGPDG